jgi:6-phosphogluconolactonase
VLEDPAAACAELLGEAAGAGGQLVLTGGSSPRTAYSLAAAAGIDWRSAGVWFSDERCVAPEDERSNYGMTRDALLTPLGDRAPSSVHRIQGEFGAVPAADTYQDELLAGAGGQPRFALVLIGLGPDAHLASLFPGQDTLAERERLAVAVPDAGLEPYVPRVSLTLPALAAGERVVFLIMGSSKAQAVAAAFSPGVAPDPSVPASMLVPMHERIEVLLDREAAAQL